MGRLDDRRLGIRLLGGFAVSVAGSPVPDAAWRLRRARTLVKLLALAPERRLHREQLTELLWPGGDPAANALHQVLYTARRALTGDQPIGLAMRDDVVELAADGLWIDVDAFERAAASARAAPAVAVHRAALELYAGELLPEDRYEDWSVARRQALRETHLGLLVELAELQAASADAAGAVETLQRAVIEDPLHEVAHRELMRRFAGDGRQQQALAQYQQLRQALRSELEAEPDPESRRLYREILAGQHEPPPAPAAQRAPPAATPATLGEPAARSGAPGEATSFVGRERELGQLAELLDRTRLLTLSGPGGCGKTRLAVALAARRAGDFEHGTPLVELAPISDPALVVEQTAAALGMRLRSEDDPIAVLAGQIGAQRVLIVLDNCEHLVDAAARLADALLRACPGVRVLATSRERLRIEGEVAWRVPPLSLPEPDAAGDPGRLARSEAVALFCRRAADVAPDFVLDDDNAAAVAEVCRRLDGMPLALELAAARTAVLAPAQIAARLGDALALLRGGSRTALTRQQTLRATLAWSHDLLDETERALYRRLGVFAGSFGVEAVEAICGEDGADALDPLSRLVDKSLVGVERGRDGYRYRLLETVRQDARERLAAAGERDRLDARHRDWYLALAEAADRDADPGVAAAWPAERVEAELDDLRAALGSAIRHDTPAALRLASALWWLWIAGGSFVEGARWLDQALAAAPDPTPDRARALTAAAGIRVRLPTGHIRDMLAAGGEALAIARAGGDRHAEARCLERLGVIAMGAFDFRSAERVFAEGLALARELGDEAIAVAILQAQGVLAGCRGENALARELLEESLAQLDEIGDDRGPLFWAMHISPVVLPAGPGGAPRAFFEDTFVLLRAVRSRAGQGYVLCNIAETWRADGDAAAGADALERALALFEELGDEQGAGVALNALGNLARSTGDFETGRARFAGALGLRRAARDRREIATTLAGLGLLELYAGDAPAGRRLVDEALDIFARSDDGPGSQLLPLNLGSFELDFGDPREACALLERCDVRSRAQGLVRNRGWASAQLGEAALAIGEHARARHALDGALAVFEEVGETRGTRYAAGLAQRLERVMSGC